MQSVMQSATAMVRCTTLGSSRRPALRSSAPPALLVRQNHTLSFSFSNEGDANEEDDGAPEWFKKFRQEAAKAFDRIEKLEQLSLSQQKATSALVAASGIMAESQVMAYFRREVENYTNIQCRLKKYRDGRLFSDIDKILEFYGGKWGLPTNKAALVAKLIAVDAIRQGFIAFLPVALKAATNQIVAHIKANKGRAVPDLTDVTETYHQLQRVLELHSMKEAAGLAGDLQDMIGEHLNSDVRRTFQRFVYTCNYGQEQVADSNGAALSAVMWEVARQQRVAPNVSGQLEINAAGGVLLKADQRWLVMGEAKSNPTDEDAATLQLRISLHAVKYILEACGGPNLQLLGIVLLMSRVEATTRRTLGAAKFVIRQLRPDPIFHDDVDDDDDVVVVVDDDDVDDEGRTGEAGEPRSG